MFIFLFPNSPIRNFYENASLLPGQQCGRSGRKPTPSSEVSVSIRTPDPLNMRSESDKRVARGLTKLFFKPNSLLKSWKTTSWKKFIVPWTYCCTYAGRSL
ncbi:hypothetical protein RRG08_007828 [Elysia crispata]|uniref:Uncharacterized protein n=1 Tax=Elysia crispata TaxID=231223 RepID=A0AAE1CNI0_9GAST|nr:hypothetical protein RRG08_007828 [Elysia crispata]